MLRAFGGSTFEEEKHAVLMAAYGIAQAQQEPWSRMYAGQSLWELYMELDIASPELRQDREVFLAVVSVDGELLQKADESLRNDVQVVRAACALNAKAFQFASEDLRRDRDLLLDIFQLHAGVLDFASDECRGDREFVLKALDRASTASGVERALRYASSELQNDANVVLKAVELSPTALRLGSPTLRQDKEFMLLAARSARDGQAEACYNEADEALKATMSLAQFEGAVASCLACRGEVAPVLSLAWSDPSDPGGELPGTSDIVFVATLLSGSSFKCSVPIGQEPTIDDVAKQLCDELAVLLGQAPQRRIALVLTNGSGEPVPVGPWDWDCPLLNFLASARCAWNVSFLTGAEREMEPGIPALVAFDGRESSSGEPLQHPPTPLNP